MLKRILDRFVALLLSALYMPLQLLGVTLLPALDKQRNIPRFAGAARRLKRAQLLVRFRKKMPRREMARIHLQPEVRRRLQAGGELIDGLPAMAPF